MNGNLRTLLMAVFFVGTASVANADESGSGVLRGRLGASHNSFDTLWSGGDLNTDYVSTNAGVTFISSTGLSFDLALKKSNSANWNTRELILPPIGSDGEDESYDRKDYTLTVGKSFSGGWQVFAGYQKSTSDIGLPQYWVTNYQTKSSERFTVKGGFAGVGKSFAIGDGSLNLNAAVGAMKGELIDSIGSRNSSGRDSGYSFGVSYAYYITKNFGISLDVKRQSYRYKYPNNPDIALTSGNDNMTAFGINFIVQTEL